MAKLRVRLHVSDGELAGCPAMQGGGEPAQLAGRPLTQPAELLNLDTLSIGDRRYRFRRLPVGGV